MSTSDIDKIAYLLNIGNCLLEIVGLIIIIISTIGNLCNYIVFVYISPLNKHPNALFIIGSSIGSLIFINTGLLTTIIQLLTGINLLEQSLFWCKINLWLTYSSGCFSFMCYCFAAFSQFLLTLPKIKWQRLITPIRAQIMILLTALIWLLIFIPLPIFYNHIQISTTITCINLNSFINLYASCGIIIGYYGIPILLILILFSLTWYNMRQLLIRRRSLEGAVTRMMLIQMNIILMSGIPAGICIIYILSTQYYSKPPLRTAYEYVVGISIVLFTFFTNGITFWIYLFASKTFRKHLKRFFISKWNFLRNRILPLTILTTRTNNTAR
ncbi:unnamed protein product [Adineta steineri]|uniref:G-protein coupled receptors family 1 profile domain-containing protein n=1 Tax=Adineta steineri TaxID=433720 RepID=A0A819G8J2_9BILA|nr:unnamed protein product [Adineta steineri]CAF3880263.1 unnamed protein product [Adineta steineri]